MGRYLADTNMLVMYSLQIEPETSLLTGMIEDGEDLGIIDVVVAEYLSGVPEADRLAAHQFLQMFEFWDAGYAVAARAGEYRYAFARRGIQIHVADALIAAAAVELDATLVTRNRRHFPMTDLKLLVP